MGKVAVLAIVVACCCGVLSAAKPMETLNRYNVVLVHGAAPESQGFGSECSGTIHNAYAIAYNNITKLDKTIHSRLGSAVGMLGAYGDTFDPDSSDDSEYNVKASKKLTYWLDSAVFEDFQYRNGKVFMDSTNLFGSPYIYLQRSFANPAETPAHNAHEIGDRTWKGDNKCSVRRSLIEEAQEVRAGGSGPLDSLRTDIAARYRTIPSRNIIISHSMGGVSSREYVQSDFYNKDVDKLITLDSPHEGTESLNMLLALKERVKSGKKVTSDAKDALLPLGIAMVQDPTTVQLGLVTLVGAYLVDAVQVAVDSVVLMVLGEDYDYHPNDPLVDYIDPNKPGGVKDLVKRETPDMPMMRILAGEHSMTFTDPEIFIIGDPMKGVLPDEAVLPTLNAWTFLGESGDKSTDYVNALAGFELGALGGVTIRDLIVC
ncbi:MAG: hypothetical protein J6W54_00495 [Fibrobacter sp.]|uniref:esterase/lipase family protein n=1 Tax=Fibrobacter sp. TaxID=35828 RepID=UPI001B15DC18|nr:hypothetical protein [Fibrobacter sp.]MBO7059567.1 hypothetical protein [Fibrobacter sp.]